MKKAIEINDVAYTYPDATQALQSISFDVEAGECVGLIGPSGAGKSTLASILVGFLFPQKGSAKICGIEVDRKTVSDVRKNIGLIFQNPDDQLFMPTLFDDVAFGLVQRGVSGDELKSKVSRAIADRSLAGLESKFTGHLSGGQKRLAALAGVLVMEPEVLLLDEPTSNLDPCSRRNLIDQLAQMKNTRIVAGHDLEMVLDLCDRTIILSGGKIVADGNSFDLLADEKLMKANCLEVPHSLTPGRHRHHRVTHSHEHD